MPRKIPWTLAMISAMMISYSALIAFVVHKSIETGVATAIARGRIIQETRAINPAGFERIVHALSILGWGSGILGAIGLVSIGRSVFSKTARRK